MEYSDKIQIQQQIFKIWNISRYRHILKLIRFRKKIVKFEYVIFNFKSVSEEVQGHIEYIPYLFRFNSYSKRMEYGILYIKYEVVGQKMIYLAQVGVTLKLPPSD